MAITATEWPQGLYNSDKASQRGIRTGVWDRGFGANLNASHKNSLRLHSLVYKIRVIVWWHCIFLRPVLGITLKPLHHPWSEISPLGSVFSSTDPQQLQNRSSNPRWTDEVNGRAQTWIHVKGTFGPTLVYAAPQGVGVNIREQPCLTSDTQPWVSYKCEPDPVLTDSRVQWDSV